MSKFKDKYQTPEAEKIRLEDVVFHVHLPTSANRKFERAVAGSMTRRDPATGAFKIRNLEMIDIFEAQHAAFLKSCVVKVEGMDFDPEEFMVSYPDAVEELYLKAMELAEQREEDATAAVGKSQPSSPGQENGLDGKVSTLDSLTKAG